MRIILDESAPAGLRRMLAPRDVTTVQLAGFKSYKNGKLLEVLEGNYEVFITADKNLRHQQNLTGRKLAVVELPTNLWPKLRLLQAKIISAVDQCAPGAYIVVEA